MQREHVFESLPLLPGAGVTRVGYARVSTVDQDPALQLAALERAGVERVYQDRASGADPRRPELLAALDYLRAGDVLIVWKLDRLGRSLRHLVNVGEQLAARGVELVSLTEGIDTTTPAGRMLFGLLAVLAEFERDLIRERVAAGVAAARENGRAGGRPRALNPHQQQLVDELLLAGEQISVIAQTVGTSRATVYRAKRRQEAASGG